MALNIIIVCIIAVQALIALLVWDLMNRNRRLVLFMEASHKAVKDLRALIAAQP